MISTGLRKRLKKVYYQVNTILHESFSSPNHGRFSKWMENIRLGVTKPQIFAYQLVGGKSSRLFPLFKDLDSSLKKSGMKSNFKAYVSTTILAGLLLFASIIIIIPTLLFFIFNLSIFLSILFGLGFSLFAGAITVIAFYVYPSYRADNLKREDYILLKKAGFNKIQTGIESFSNNYLKKISANR